MTGATTQGAATTVWLDSNDVNGSLQRYRDLRADVLGINYLHGYQRPDLEPIRGCTFIRGLELMPPPGTGFGLEPLRSLSNLEALYLHGPITIPLRELPSLVTFAGDWHAGLSLDGAVKLRVLRLGSFRPKSGGLDVLPSLPDLLELELSGSSITSTVGLDRFGALETLKLHHCNRLEAWSQVASAGPLKLLHAANCRKLRGDQGLEGLTHLETLVLHQCGPLASLKFLQGLPELREFRFYGTVVGDGDLSPLLALQRVAFKDRKTYSHRAVEIDAVLRAKGGGAIVRVED